MSVFAGLNLRISLAEACVCELGWWGARHVPCCVKRDGHEGRVLAAIVAPPDPIWDNG